MKTILVPIDFSHTSNNAVDYAAKMALITNAKLILLNVYHIPAMPAEVPVVIPDIESFERDSKENLQKINQRIFLSYGKAIEVEMMSKCGFAAEEISSYADAIKPDLIIMGISGTNRVTERVFGSVATSVVEHCNYPVLLVGEGIEFKVPRKIALACDYNESENAKVIGPLIKLSKFFKSHICVINIEKELEPAGPAGEIVWDFIQLKDSLSGVDHSFHFVGSDNVIKGINEFVSLSNIDMVVMMPKKHGVLSKLFKEPTTKKLAFHSRAPLFTLPNKNI
jgi:nucleotide-binding universal stress UspA family protein